jgi:hypothetical protein
MHPKCLRLSAVNAYFKNYFVLFLLVTGREFVLYACHGESQKAILHEPSVDTSLTPSYSALPQLVILWCTWNSRRSIEPKAEWS